MELRRAISKVLFNNKPELLTNSQIRECNKQIDIYNEINDIVNEVC